MTDQERASAAWAYCKAHTEEWDAYLTRPLADRLADQDKVQQTIDDHGLLAARSMARALGLPVLPDDLCDPIETLDTRYAELQAARDPDRRAAALKAH